MLLFLCTTSMASEVKEYIEFSSGETDDGSIYLDSYEDYLKALGNVDEQEVYKEEYLNYIASAITSYDLSERTDITKARVLDVGAKKDYYSSDSYYGISKVSYQTANVEILEGKFKGEKFEISYILTADSYENLKIKEIKENQKINVVIVESGDEAYAYATTVDAAIDRTSVTIWLIIITLFVAVIFLGKRVFKFLPQLLLLADMILLIFVPELLSGRSILWLTIVTCVLYVVVEAVIKLGVNSKAVAAIFSSIVSTIALACGLFITCNIANFSGITFEVLNMVETFPKGTIDFYMLYISGFVLLCAIVTSNLSCVAIIANGDKDKLRDDIVDKIPLFICVLFVSIIPKYLYLLMSKYVGAELINSEMLLGELYKSLFLIIAMAVTVQITEYSKKLFID